jgi:recombinational DNA repair ATPase RecF
MFVKEITLKGYNRLSNLNNFNLIKVKFTKKIQAILGTNGSGKSSFIEELSPLPAEAKNFTKDGYKEIIYLHKGKTYVLKSSFNPVVHSFLVDDEELNPGGTIT